MSGAAIRTARRLVVMAAAGSLAACAVGPAQLEQALQEKRDVTAAAKATAQSQMAVEPALVRIQGNYLGGHALPLLIGARLPERMRDVTLNFGPGRGSLDMVAHNIRAATGLAVRIDPDLGQASPAGSPAPAIPLPAGLPASALRAPLPPGLGTPVVGISPAGAAGAVLPLSFKGDLSDYLQGIASTLNINWEYANGELHFFRNITRTFSLLIPPGSITFRDDMNGNASGSLGASSGTNGQSSGQFGSNSTSAVSASYDPWSAIDQALKSMISSTGRYAVSQASGTLVVSDTRDVVDRIAAWVAHENRALNTQVAVDVRRIDVQLDDASQGGIDLNLIFQQLNAASGAQDWAFKFNAPGSLADAGAGSAGFNVTKSSSRLAGTAITAQALNRFGRVVSDTSETLVTTNRAPGRKQGVTEQAYLASTSAAVGGGVAGGTGVPGLTPGVVTYGSQLTVIPTIAENNQVLLQLFDSTSNLIGINSVGTGQGQTLQQINTPILSRKKVGGTFVIGQGETLVIVTSETDHWSGNSANGIGGASFNGTHTRSLQVFLVTPRILVNG